VFYDFVCDTCGNIQTISASITRGPGYAGCCMVDAEHGPVRRVYGDAQTIVRYDSNDYLDKAYKGETSVPSLTNAQVRAIVDVDYKVRAKGRGNAPRRHRRIVR